MDNAFLDAERAGLKTATERETRALFFYNDAFDRQWSYLFGWLAVVSWLLLALALMRWQRAGALSLDTATKGIFVGLVPTVCYVLWLRADTATRGAPRFNEVAAAAGPVRQERTAAGGDVAQRGRVGPVREQRVLPERAADGNEQVEGR